MGGAIITLMFLGVALIGIARYVNAHFYPEGHPQYRKRPVKPDPKSPLYLTRDKE